MTTGPTLTVLLPDAVAGIVASGVHPFLRSGDESPGDARVAFEALRQFLAAARPFADAVFQDPLTRMLRTIRISSGDARIREWARRLLLAGD